MSTTLAISSRPKTSAYCVAPPCNFQPLRKRPTLNNNNTTTTTNNNNNTRTHTPPKYIPLRNVIPTCFDDMYTPDVLGTSQHVTPEGRPLFTRRDVVDWTKNDVRSLLILNAPKPEWKGTIPQIIETGYRIQILPFSASDQDIIDTLVSSDLYKEHNFEHRFLVQTAQYTVKAARERQFRSRKTDSSTFDFSNPPALTKPEWRNIIENYLLNLACEAQCRVDFQQNCAHAKHQKQMLLEHGSSNINNNNNKNHKITLDNSYSPSTTTPAQFVPQKSISNTPSFNSKSTSPLLKKALLASLSTSPEFQARFGSSSPGTSPTKSLTKSIKVSLTRAEKQQIWVKVQSSLYSRLGLNWQPDELV